MRQNAFLASTQIVRIQGLTEAALESIIGYRDGNGMEIETKARDLLTKYHGVLALEKTNLTEERGKYVLVCEKGDGETREFIDFACRSLNDERTEQIRHNTHSEIRRASSTKWSTQIPEHQSEMIVLTGRTHQPKRTQSTLTGEAAFVAETPVREETQTP